MMEVFILIVVKPGNEEKVFNRLKDNPRVREIYRLYGEYDIVVRIEVNSIRELDEFHDSVLRRIKEIEMTETLIASSYGS
ncbi:Lrp/AsnC ligand binding domain-containing protein [Thermococcus atlanticus]